MTLTTTPRLARGVGELGTESAFAVLARARALERRGSSIVHLEIGQPDFPTPEHVVEAAAAAMARGEQLALDRVREFLERGRVTSSRHGASYE